MQLRTNIGDLQRFANLDYGPISDGLTLPGRCGNTRPIVENCGFSMRTLIVTLSLFLSAGAAQAYIGPGLGGGLVASVLAVLAGIFMLLLGVVYYPLKKLFGSPAKSGKKPVDRASDETAK
jgi:hypothetical protein